MCNNNNQKMEKGDIGGNDYSINTQTIIIEKDNEVSDIGMIIKEIISLKIDGKSDYILKKIPYSITDKINYNEINLRANEIMDYHNEEFSIIEEAIECLMEFDTLVADELFEYYKCIYRNVLVGLKLADKNVNEIKNNSDKIYTLVVDHVCENLMISDKDIKTNRKITYVKKISAFVFYKCKFLLPIL